MTAAFDSILSYHLNPLTCGIAKFNLCLGDHLGLPVLPLFTGDALVQHPLLSLKVSEFIEEDRLRLQLLAVSYGQGGGYDAFFHEYLGGPIELGLARGATRLFSANTEITETMRIGGLSPIELWAPGMLVDQVPFEPSELRIFSFGMAHKLRTGLYQKLHTLLESTGKNYRIYLSTAIHEGTGLDGSFESAFRELGTIFGDRIYFLGYLSDMAIYNHLLTTTYFCAFFEKGVRANNTSVHAAMKAGAAVITNLDHHSPKTYIHGVSLLDILQVDRLTTDPKELSTLRNAGARVARSHDWSALAQQIRSPHA